MKAHARTALAAVIATMLMCPPLLVGDAGGIGIATAQTAPAKAGWYGKQVDLATMKQYAVLPKRADVTIVDARPAARKYDIGHIPTAINIPDSQFDQLAPKLLPQDKAQLVIFYCDGPECMLSHNSAHKAEKLGYTNVRVHVGGFPEWAQAGNLVAVSIPQLKKVLDAKEPLTLVDARPRERKYDKGHIPGAISLPDSQFDKLAAQLLPADKAAALYFYCDGLECKLSNDSAEKAVKLGYTNVKVVPEGWPGWDKAYGAGVAAAAAPAIVAGKEPGSIAVPSFEQILREAPQSVHLIDVRDPQEFAAGTFKGAVNMPVGSIDKNLDQLPRDKPIVFFCGAGGRSGEAHDVVKSALPTLKTVFVDATIKWKQTGEYTITAK
jgi:rhodanese-related sulfurtransferase